MTEEEQGGAVEGFSLTGDEVLGLEDKHLKIVAVPRYVDVKDLDNPEKMKRKLHIPIELANGTQTEWLANKTSQKTIINKCGRLLKDWVGYVGEFEVRKEDVFGAKKQVIYLKE